MTTLLSRFLITGDGDAATSIDILGTGTSKAAIFLISAKSQSSAGITLNSITFDGKSGEILYQKLNPYSNFAVIYFNEINLPAVAGTYTLQCDYSGSAQETAFALYELTNAPQVSTGFIVGVTDATGLDVVDTPYVFTYTLAGASGDFVIPFLAAMDSGYFDPTTTGESANMLANESFQDTTYAMLFTYEDLSAASNSEVYSGTYNHGRAGKTPDGLYHGAIAITAIGNADPVLDTPQADIEFGTDASVSINIGSNFSDINGDPLTITVSPALPSGLTLAAGIITNTSALSVTAVANYTFTADDGGGGTLPTDVVAIEITAPVFTIGSPSSLVPEAGSTLTIPISNAAGTITAFDSAGPIVVLTQTATEITFATQQPLTHGDKSLDFEENVVITLNDSVSNKAMPAIQIQAESGYVYGKVTTVDPLGIYADDGPGVVAGVSVYGQVLTGDYIPEIPTGLGTNSVNSTYRYAMRDTSWGPWVDPVESFIVNNPPTGLPVVTGTTKVGSILTVDGSAIADIDGLGAFSYQWQRNGSDITGATATTYTLVAVDYQTLVNCVISYTDALGVAEAITSANIVAITSETPVGLPTISGIIKEGEVLTARTDGISDADGLGGFTYKWKRGGVDIVGATSVTYLLDFDDIGSVITVEVSYVDGVGVTEVLLSAATIAVVEITRVISILSANRLVDIDGIDVTYVFPLWEIWDKIPEDPTANVIDSGTNLSIVNGLGATPILQNITESTEYLLVGRDSGNTPTLVFRVWGTPA